MEVNQRNNKRKKISPIAKREADLLRALFYLNGKQRVLVLRKADRRLIRCICECALNVLLGNVTLTRKERNHLRRYATVLRQLVDKKKKNKKKVVIQHGSGGFLPGLLLPIISTVLNQLL